MEAKSQFSSHPRKWQERTLVLLKTVATVSSSASGKEFRAIVRLKTIDIFPLLPRKVM